MWRKRSDRCAVVNEYEVRTTIETDEGERLVDIFYEAECRHNVYILSVWCGYKNIESELNLDDWVAVELEAAAHYEALCDKAQADSEDGER